MILFNTILLQGGLVSVALLSIILIILSPFVIFYTLEL